MKKILSLLLALTLVFSLFSMCGITASAASYPSVWLNTSGNIYVGDNVPLLFTYMPAYNNEKITVNIYEPDGTLRANADFDCYNGYTRYGNLTVDWDTTGYEPGRYKVEVVKQFYTYYNWYTAPNNSVSYITLKKPTDKKAVNNPFKGGSEKYKVSQNKTVAATKKGIKNSYNAWQNLYVKNASVPFNIQLSEMILGDKAESIVKNENSYNFTASNGHWVLMKFKVKNRGKSSFEFGDIINWTSAYLSSGEEATLLDTPTWDDYPHYDTSIAPGETEYVWVGYQVLKTQGIPFVKLDCGIYLNVNPLCAKTHKYSNSSDASCNKCNASRAVVKSVKLSTTKYTYNGSTKTPNVVVKDSNGKTLKKNTDYTVTYASGRKNPGKYKVTVKFKGNYSGTKTLYFTINPPKTKVLKVTPAKKSLKVYVSKKSKGVSGYEIQYATNKKFTSAKTKRLTSASSTSVTIKGLNAKKTYFVRVRTYKTVSGKKYYSAWSSIAYKKTK